MVLCKYVAPASVLLAVSYAAGKDAGTAFALPEDTITITEETQPLTQKNAALISNLTLHALRRVDDAVQALSAGQATKAKDDLYHASFLLESVRAELPLVILRDHIWRSAKKAEQDKVIDLQPDLVPVVAQLDLIKEFAPAKKAKDLVSKAQENAKVGDNKAAAARLRDAMNILESDEIDVRIDKMQQAINKGISLIDGNQPKQALAELKSASFIEVFDNTLYAIPNNTKAAH